MPSINTLVMRVVEWKLRAQRFSSSSGSGYKDLHVYHLLHPPSCHHFISLQLPRKKSTIGQSITSPVSTSTTLLLPIMQLTTIFVATLITAVVSARAVAPVEAVVPVEKREACPDPFSPCQYDDNGECQMGYAACLQKMGCSNTPGGADCIGTSLGELSLI